MNQVQDDENPLTPSTLPLEDAHNSNDRINATVIDNNNSNNNNNTSNAEINNTIEEDDITEVNILPSRPNQFNSDYNTPETNNRLWTREERASYEERRREALGTELARVQKSNFIHFSLLCSVPMLLIGLVLWNSLNNDGECNGFAPLNCRKGEGGFMNAFADECICDAFNVTFMEE
jgi:hypothetical protein